MTADNWKPQRYERTQPYAMRNVPFAEEGEDVPTAFCALACAVCGFGALIVVLLVL